MRHLFRTGLCAAAMALAAPAFAQSTTNFDGTYAGVSLTASGSGHACAAASPVPAPLTVAGSNAKTTQGQAAFQGTVNAQGNLTLRTPLATVMTGKIEADGTAHGGLTIGHDCTYSFTWKKR